MTGRNAHDGEPIYDSGDIDLFVKVANHTVFSPFFIFFVPIFFLFQGAKVTDPGIIGLFAYWVSISLFWFIKWYSRLWRNQGSLFFAPKRFDWGEQIVVITGGSSGIGELLANTLAVRNVNVVVLDVKPIVTENYNITYYKCDVSKWEEVEAVSAKVKEEIGDPTVIVNNAGVVQGKLILDLSPSEIEQTFGVNTLAHFWTLKAFLPAMIERKEGHVVTVASVMGLVSSAQMSDYCAAKAAAIAMTDSLRCELDHKYNTPNIRTTVVCTGHVLTQLFEGVEFPKHPLWRFLFPTLHPVAVVKRIIAALDEQHSQTIFLPFYTNFAPFMNILPSFLHDALQWISSADHAMTNFVKNSEGKANHRVSAHKEE